jgi:glycerol-3-phosphate acyltransferase PlsY
MPAYLHDGLLAFALGYLLGAIPFGWLLTRFSGKGDIRDIGSGGIGATNVLRTGSKGLAAATLLLDALKGAAAVLLVQRLWPGGMWSDAVRFAAAGALLGHLYPVWLKFRGGKGVATLLGILAALFWPAALTFAVVWLTMFLLLRISSVAGMTAAASAPVVAAIMGRNELVPMLTGFALLVIWKHKENLARLRAGTEPRVGRAAS